jgi:hypothetical protein
MDRQSVLRGATVNSLLQTVAAFNVNFGWLYAAQPFSWLNSGPLRAGRDEENAWMAFGKAFCPLNVGFIMALPC